jgi:hypothetical protein
MAVAKLKLESAQPVNTSGRPTAAADFSVIQEMCYSTVLTELGIDSTINIIIGGTSNAIST